MTDSPLTQLSAAERQRIDDAFEKVPFARLLGIEAQDLQRGRATLAIDLRPELLQNHGVVHGGVTASLIDTASAFAILTMLEPDQSTTTVDLTIHYLRPMKHGRITAIARVLRAGRRVIVASVEVLDPGEKLAATAITTYLRLTGQAEITEKAALSST
jgi:uncharacterized protein (TIGR00369 family)